MSELSWDDYVDVTVVTPKQTSNVQSLTTEELLQQTKDKLKHDPLALQVLENMNFQGLISSPVLNFGGPRLKTGDKRIIGGTSDLNQLIPFQYEWAWQKYLDGSKNHWMPMEVPMARDIQQWRTEGALSEQERHIVRSCLGYFASADSVVANNLALGIYRHITSPEHRQYILRQALEEAIHQHAYQYCIQSIGLDEGEVFNAYREVPSMAAKAAYSLKLTKEIADPNFVIDINDVSTVKTFVRNLVGYYCVTEGIFFYCGFPLILSMGRSNKLPGTAEQFQYILRDESMHLNFGIDTINQIRIENPNIWTAEFQKELRDLLLEAVTLEKMFALDCIGKGVLGMSVTSMWEYLEFIANRRCIQIGLPQIYPNAQNSFPWMSEMMDLRKEKNFFETRVTEYQASSNLWGDNE